MQHLITQAPCLVISADEKESLAKTLEQLHKSDYLKVELAEFEQLNKQFGGAVAALAGEILQEMWNEQKLD